LEEERKSANAHCFTNLQIANTKTKQITNYLKELQKTQNTHELFLVVS
jgi:hypothetical protein